LRREIVEIVIKSDASRRIDESVRQSALAQDRRCRNACTLIVNIAITFINIAENLPMFLVRSKENRENIYAKFPVVSIEKNPKKNLKFY